MKESRYGAKNGNWKGGRRVSDDGRIFIYSPNHPNPDIGRKGTRYCYLYRLKMEKKLGRYLKKNEVVHHKDGNPSNNKIYNLEVMTRSKHCGLHWVITHRKRKTKRYEEKLELYEKSISLYYQGLSREKICNICNINIYEFTTLFKDFDLEIRGNAGKYNSNYKHGRMCK